MKLKLGGIAVAFIVLFSVALLVGFPVCWLWNWLMPHIFGLPKIGFWEAWGLLLLLGLLFGGKTGSTSKDSDNARNPLLLSIASISEESSQTGDNGIISNGSTPFSPKSTERAQKERKWEREEEVKQTFSLNQDEYEVISFNVPDIWNIRVHYRVHYVVDSEHPVSVYILDEDGLDDFEEDRDFEYYEGKENRRCHDEKVHLPHRGTYYLVIDNEDNENTAVHYELFLT